MEQFKCPMCKGTEPHIRIKITKNGKKQTIDWLFDIRNPALNSRVVIKACKLCHALSAWWEDFDTSNFVSKRDKQIADFVLKDKPIQSKEGAGLTKDALEKEEE